MYHIRAGGTRLFVGCRASGERMLAGWLWARVISSPGARRFTRTLIGTLHFQKKSALPTTVDGLGDRLANKTQPSATTP
jgi:hypothetical protein